MTAEKPRTTFVPKKRGNFRRKSPESPSLTVQEARKRISTAMELLQIGPEELSKESGLRIELIEQLLGGNQISEQATELLIKALVKRASAEIRRFLGVLELLYGFGLINDLDE